MRNSLSSVLAGIALSGFLNGCASVREITSLEGILPKWQYDARPEHRSVDSLRRFYYTPEAYEAIKDVPVINGPTFTDTSYAAGTTILSNIASFLSFNGVGRKVIASANSIRRSTKGIDCILHEDIHHFDDMGHDGESDFINHDEFMAAYYIMSRDERYKRIVFLVERKAAGLSWFTDIFGVCELGERIAYTGDYLATHPDSPEYMRRVFERVFDRRIYAAE